MDEAVLCRLRETWQRVDDLNGLLRSIPSCIQQQNRPAEIQRELDRLRTRIQDQYEQSIEAVTDMLRTVSNIMNHPPDALPTSTDLPSRETVRDLVHSFFTDPIETRSSPLPIHSGCYSYRISHPIYGQYVCGRLNGSFILMIVINCSSETGKCSVFDPADIDNGINVIELSAEDWIALPTVIPARPVMRWEFPVGTEVLALWPNGSEWTTEFYKARVVSPPHARGEDAERGYELSFDEEVKVVPEKFVVKMKDEWKS